MRWGCVVVLLLAATPAAAQHLTGEVTPFVGYQTGGTIVIADRNAPLDDAPAFGVMVTFDRGAGRKLDLVFAHETTNAIRSEPRPSPTPDMSYRTYVDYAQIGGRYVFSPAQTVAPYIALTVGGTWIGANGESVVAFSFAYGAGADVRLNERTAIRFDGRFTRTIAPDTAVFRCDSSGSCSGLLSGTSITQFTASAGVVVRF